SLQGGGGNSKRHLAIAIESHESKPQARDRRPSRRVAYPRRRLDIGGGGGEMGTGRDALLLYVNGRRDDERNRPDNAAVIPPGIDARRRFGSRASARDRSRAPAVVAR